MNIPTPQTSGTATPAPGPVIYTPVPLSPLPEKDAVTVPTPAKGNDEVMSQQPAKTT